MAVLKIGTIELNPNMQIPSLNAANKVSQTNAPTIGGGIVIFQQAIKAGLAVQLTATEDQGWVDKDARDQLLEVANRIGEVLVLTVNSRTFNVMFDHSNGAAVQLEPLINRLEPLDGDYFTGSINLITV